MRHRLGLALAATVALGAAPQIALACSGDACSSVSAGTWSDGKVTITDKDTSGKITVKYCLKDPRTCNTWGIKPGSNSVALKLPLANPPPKNTTVEITDATYDQKPDQPKGSGSGSGSASGSGSSGSGNAQQAQKEEKYLTFKVTNVSPNTLTVHVADWNQAQKEVFGGEIGPNQSVSASVKAKAVAPKNSTTLATDLRWKAVAKIDENGKPAKETPPKPHLPGTPPPPETAKQPLTWCGASNTYSDGQDVRVGLQGSGPGYACK